jgi:serine/threonine-protein kinase
MDLIRAWDFHGFLPYCAADSRRSTSDRAGESNAEILAISCVYSRSKAENKQGPSIDAVLSSLRIDAAVCRIFGWNAIIYSGIRRRSAIASRGRILEGKMFRFKVLIVVPLLLLLALLLPSTQAAAQDYFGAMAFSQETGAAGHSFDYRSRDDAEERALQECGRSCKVVLWFRNACGALATGARNGYGTGWASTRGRAEEAAISVCEENADNCRIKQWACTTR